MWGVFAGWVGREESAGDEVCDVLVDGLRGVSFWLSQSISLILWDVKDEKSIRTVGS